MAERRYMSKKPVYLEVKPHKNQQPSLEGNESLINRFLKVCSKEGLMQLIYEKSAYTKRYDKPSIVKRQKKLLHRRNAQKANSKKMADNL